MTEPQNVKPSFAQRYASIGLILLAVAALAVFLLLLRQWQAGATDEAATVAVQTDNPARLEMSQRLTQTGAGNAIPKKPRDSLFLPLLAFSLVLGAGACLGRFWPAVGSDETTTPEPQDAMVHADTPEPDEIFIEPEATVTAPPPRIINELPLDGALAAKDEVIESLENIVKENRDRWSNFEVERDELNHKIQNLNAELRVASDIIEGLHGEIGEVTYDPPQVIGRA